MKRALLAGVAALAITSLSYWAHAQSGYLRVPDDLVIEFRSAANVVSRDITFTDIALVDSADKEFVGALEQVNLGPAPSAGYTRNLTSGYIELRLRQRRINPGSLPVSLPDSVLVTSETAVLSKAAIVLAARDFVEDEMGLGSLADLDSGYVPDLVIPSGEPEIECALIAGSLEQGYVAVGTSISVGGHLVGFVRVEFGQSQPTATQHAVGTGLPEDVMQPASADASSSSPPMLLAGGGPSPYLVQRGDLVRIMVRTVFAEVTAIGEARGNGRLGDLIEIRNVDTGKRFYGRVVSAGVVEVDFSG